MLPALAFVPLEEVSSAFDDVAELIRDEAPDLAPLVEYFETNYIGTAARRPRYPQVLWNQHDRVEAGMVRTNNNVEGWHRGLLSTMAIKNPKIWRFLDELKSMIQMQDRDIEGLLAGNPLTP